MAPKFKLPVGILIGIASLFSGNIFAETVPSAAFLDQALMQWKVNEHDVARWKTLVGGIEGGQLPSDDIQFGVWELAPGATYHSHKHAVPEIYYITAGEALWSVGDESRKVVAGTTIYTRPGEVHKMVNLTREPVKAIWVWWAPGGNREVFSGDYTFTEEAPAAPNGSGFGEGKAKRVH